jgi:hypothetical protein
MVTAATQQIAAIIVSFGGAEGLEQACQRMSALLQEHAEGSEIQIEIVS